MFNWLKLFTRAKDSPAMATINHAGPIGNGLLQNGNRNGVLANDAFRDPRVAFVVLRDRWKYQEPKRGEYNFAYNAVQVRRARAAGKRYIWGIMTGKDCSATYLPSVAPWSPSIADAYRKLVLALGEYKIDGVWLRDDPLLCGTWFTGPTVPSQELHLNGMEHERGFSPAGIVANFEASIDANWEAFGKFGVPGILSVSGQPKVLLYQDKIIDLVRKRYPKALRRFQHNSLGRQTSVQLAKHHLLLLKLHKEGELVGAEAVQPGHTSAHAKFPEATYFVNYPTDLASLRKAA